MSLSIPSNPAVPHKAVIWVRAEVYKILKSGECSGRTVYQVKEFPLALDGHDRNICIRKLNELIAEVKDKCKS